MSIFAPGYAPIRTSRCIASALRRLLRSLATPPVKGTTQQLPKELEDAEDWLLDDLGLGKPTAPATDRPSRGRDGRARRARL